MSETGPSMAMLTAMTDLWRLRPPGPDNILAHPAFVRLRETCRDGYPNAGKKGPAFALSTALRALGLPCHLQKDTAHLALPVEEAAKGLDAALRATRARRIHLAPLDLAADLPPLAFGPARVCRLSADELRGVIDLPRLRRLYPRQDFDAGRVSGFHWLIVEEVVVLEWEPEERAVPVLFMDLSQDLGRIEPHKGRFPTALEEALFFLLLAPWENWSTMQEVDWRGFRVPWVYTIDSDIFVRPGSPLSPDTLSWEDRVYDDGYGGTYEEERPVELHLEEEAKTELTVWTRAGGRPSSRRRDRFCSRRQSPISSSAHSWPRAWTNSLRTSRRSRQRSACARTIRRTFASRLTATKGCAPQIECGDEWPACWAIDASLTSMSNSSTCGAHSCMGAP